MTTKVNETGATSKSEYVNLYECNNLAHSILIFKILTAFDVQHTAAVKSLQIALLVTSAFREFIPRAQQVGGTITQQRIG